LLTESEKVAQALLLRFVSGEHVAIWAANGPRWVMIELGGMGVENVLDLAGIDILARKH
jgi:hypothetical protein